MFKAPKGKYKITGHIDGKYFERDATQEESEHFDSTFDKDNKRIKKPIHYSDLSPLRRAWANLWKTPTYTKEEVIELNKDFINDFSKKNEKKGGGDDLQAQELLDKGQCPCGSTDNTGCSVTGCPLPDKT